ncbi:glycosyltransferase family protein [Helcobacillus massiliensis]|uniref:Glycosyltransferase involved in cell wall biosynthesis n=1 Tax=Helcobacillus massiliensis TaxID=521392 RepID=A0A839QX57_9MICO|nr:glycosyltransferase [Helcobacillus massiliensis]MBB3021957.1 glycosyltransferase involved in cell wall biosynthesis [Helcobacillus massiliensis]
MNILLISSRSESGSQAHVRGLAWQDAPLLDRITERLNRRGDDVEHVVLVPADRWSRTRPGRSSHFSTGEQIREYAVGEQIREYAVSGPAAGQCQSQSWRRRAARALRALGTQRPDVIIAVGAEEALALSHDLSVASGVPFMAVVTPGVAPSRSRRAREAFGHALQEAATIIADDSQAQQLLAQWPLFTLVRSDDESPHALADLLLSNVEDAAASAARPRMLFHAPFELAAAPTSASRQRPNKMYEAFLDAGYQVSLIHGDPLQRAQDFQRARRRVDAGQRIDFAYSENSTQPNLLSTSAFRGLAPLLELRILAWCDRRGIPYGQFYRDVYWRFPEKQKSVPLLRRLLMQLAYRVDLWGLRRFRAHLFLPSLAMAEHLPGPAVPSTALPPGAQVREARTGSGLSLLYVGGVGPGHEIDDMLAAVKQTPSASLVVVVPEASWARFGSTYDDLLCDRVTVEHAGSNELGRFYDQASACLLLVRPNQYRRFAVPMKLFEYIGFGKPVIASAQTLAGDMVDDLDVGFSVPYDRDSIAALLRSLTDDPARLERAAENARTERHSQTWQKRATTAAEVLTAGADG